jgi:hypothetical protein
LSDILYAIEQQQTILNLQAAATAKQSRLLYNLNRGKNTPPLQDISDFLPYPHRYLVDKAKEKMQHVTRQAALEYVTYYTQLPQKAQSAFYSVHDVLLDIAGVNKV